MKRTFKVLFFVKRSRVTKNGEVAVQLRVTVNKEKIEVTINQTINPVLWNSTTEKATEKDRKSLEINSRLDSIRFRLMEIYREMEISGEDITARKIVNKYKGIETESKITLLTIFQEHNERCHKLEGKDMSRSTIMRYETAYRYTQEFIQFQYKKDDVNIEEVNYQFVKDYEFFLKTERDCNHYIERKCL